MKKILFIAIFSICSLSYGQLTEGYFQYSIIVTPQDSSVETLQKTGLMFDSKMELYFTKYQSRLNFVMGTSNTNSIIVDQKKKIGLSLTSNPKGSYAVQLFEKDLVYNTKTNDTSIKVKFLADKSVILGFNCKKAILTQGNAETTYWYTDEIKLDQSNQMIMNPNIPGFPLYFSTIADNMKMEYKASNYKYKVENPEEVFSLIIPQGYQIIYQGQK